MFRSMYLSSTSALFRPTDLPRRRDAPPVFSSPTIFLDTQGSKNRTLCLSAPVAERSLRVSWSSPEENPNDYGGWAVVESPIQKQRNTGLPTFLVAGIVTSVAVLVAAIAHFSLSSKGFKFQLSSPVQSLHGISATNESEVVGIADSAKQDEIGLVSESSVDTTADAARDTLASAMWNVASPDKVDCVRNWVAVDSTQQEALEVLKKLKIIEDDIMGYELCTRREYARWLVRLNSLLERNPRHRIAPGPSLSGSVVCAFDDVNVDSPDFNSIQALAEAGLILSKLSSKNSTSNGSRDKGGVYFFPDRYISRLDMINWKVQLEYEFFPGIPEQISRTKDAFMDVKDISSDASPELFMDMLAGDKSIIRKVFGQSKRFQPNLPSTKAQAAVALISGRMMEAINAEILRQETESSSMLAEMEQIRSDFLGRGFIQKLWHEKLEEEKACAVKVEEVYLAALQQLKEEKIVQEKISAEHLKEKSAMDCQKRLLVSLKEQVDQMSERLARETTLYHADQHDLPALLRNLETRLEELVDAKSLLRAEKEAIQILRSWVEDEARKSQARAKVLGEAGQRWKWNDKTGTT